MKIVSVSDFAKLMFEMKFAKGMPVFASILQQTEPKVTKKFRENGLPNPYKNIVKVSKVSVILNSEYVKAVTNILKKEDKPITDYKQGENTMPIIFGENNQIIGTYKGLSVIQYRPNDNSNPASTYFADGNEIEKSKIAGLLPVQSKATNQGTEREVFWRKVYLTNILEMTISGETYKVIQ